MGEIRVVTAGLGGVGKSATVIYLMRGIFIETYDPTIEDLHRKTLRVDGLAYMLSILDTAGQEEFSAMQGEWFQTGEAFLLMYAINDRNSFETAKKLKLRILQAKDYKMDEVVIILVGNKADLEDQREVEREDAQAFADEDHCPFFEISAKEGFNVVEVFETVVREVEKNRKKRAGAEDKPELKRSNSLSSIRKATFGRNGRVSSTRESKDGMDDAAPPKSKFCVLV